MSSHAILPVTGEDLARLDNSPADLGTFRQAWANECPWIKIVSSEALFTGCAACNYLHRLLETTPRSEVEQAHAIRLRLPSGFFVNLSYKLSGTYNLVNQVSKKNMFSQKQIKLAKKQI